MSAGAEATAVSCARKQTMRTFVTLRCLLGLCAQRPDCCKTLCSHWLVCMQVEQYQVYQAPRKDGVVADPLAALVSLGHTQTHTDTDTHTHTHTRTPSIIKSSPLKLKCHAMYMCVCVCVCDGAATGWGQCVGARGTRTASTRTW